MAKVIQNNIYPVIITVFYGDDPVDVQKYFLDNKPDSNALDHFNYSDPGTTVGDLDGDVWIYLHKDYIQHIPIIVHEAFHATEFMMDHVGIKHGRKSSEAFAYMLQYIVGEMIK